jgi:hypothetical protein
MASRLVKYVYQKRVKKVMKENKEIENDSDKIPTLSCFDSISKISKPDTKSRS